MSNFPPPYLETSDIYKSFATPYAPYADTYKSYDPSTGNNINCRFPQKGPMQVAKEGVYTTATAPTSEAYNTASSGNCVLSNFPKASYPDLYSDFDKEQIIFNKLYINNLTTGVNSSQLTPDYNNSTKNVSCPLANMVPYVLEYFLLENYTKYARFCATTEQVAQIQFNNIGDYSVFKYINADTGQDCQTSSCTTNYAPFLGHNLQPQPFVRNTPNQNNSNTVKIIVGAVAGVIVLGLIIFLLVEFTKKNEKLKKY